MATTTPSSKCSSALLPTSSSIARRMISSAWSQPQVCPCVAVSCCDACACLPSCLSREPLVCPSVASSVPATHTHVHTAWHGFARAGMRTQVRYACFFLPTHLRLSCPTRVDAHAHIAMLTHNCILVHVFASRGGVGLGRKDQRGTQGPTEIEQICATDATPCSWSRALPSAPPALFRPPRSHSRSSPPPLI